MPDDVKIGKKQPWMGRPGDVVAQQTRQCSSCHRAVRPDSRCACETPKHQAYEATLPVYLSGPMTGLPENNFPAFAAAAARLRGMGFTIISPHELDEREPAGDHPWEYYLRRDLAVLSVQCRAVAVLPGWRESRGARLEVHVARALGMEVWDAETLELVADEAPTAAPKVPARQNVLRGLPEDAGERKAAPITTGVLDYFPAALADVARLSKQGNDQHNPGQPLHWARGKSTDHADCILRHLIDRGTKDTDGMRHAAKVAWRALALLQEEIEAEAGFVPSE